MTESLKEDNRSQISFGNSKNGAKEDEGDEISVHTSNFVKDP